MKIGLFGARADNGGLGVQTWEFFRNVKPCKALIMDISVLNGNSNDFDRFNNDWGCEVEIYKTPAPNVELVSNDAIDAWLPGLDLVFCCEIPYNYYLFKKARELGIKTVLNYNYEFLDYLQRPYLPMPDLLLAPSPWHLKEVQDKFGHYTKVAYLPVPVNRDVLPFREHTQAKTFIHVAGHKLFEDRNGTEIVLNAIKFIQEDIKLIIYTQHQLPTHLTPLAEQDKRVEIRHLDIANYWEVYQEGDVTVLPRRYGGLTLQLQEAMSCGMIPIMPNVEPQNGFLHPLSLVNTSGVKTIKTRVEIDCFNIDPVMLAGKIDFLASSSQEAITKLSHYSNAHADQISWKTLLPIYLKEFNEL